MMRIPDAWPLLLDREQLSAFINLPSEAIDRLLDVPPIDLGGGILRWDRRLVEEWAQKLKPKAQQITNNEKRKLKRHRIEQEAIAFKSDALIRMHRNFVKHVIKRIDLKQKDPSRSDEIIGTEKFLFQNLINAADLYCICGERDAPLFERLERELAQLTGTLGVLVRDKRPPLLRARAIVQSIKEVSPRLTLLSSSLAELQVPRRSQGRR